MAQQAGHDNAILDSFKLVAETHRQIETVRNRAKGVVRRFYKSPEDLAAFIERKGTPVYILGGPGKATLAIFLIRTLGFEPGFIPPAENRRYQALSRFLANFEKHPGTQFDYGVFVLTPPLFTVGYISHQLHHWLSNRSGMSGYGERAQQLYQEFWSRHQGQITSGLLKMSPIELQGLRDAINRDLEALLFLREIVNEVFTPANQGKKIMSGHSQA